MADAKASTTETTVPKQLTPWKPGQSGNPAGRPKGTRHKLDQLFVDALYSDFKVGGAEAVRKCREEKPDVYLRVVAQIVPKEVQIDATDAAVDLAKGLHAVAEFLESFAAEGSSADHAGIVPDGPVLSSGVRAQAH